MADQDPRERGNLPNEDKIKVPLGVIPPCDKYKSCLVAHSKMGSMAMEHKGYMYFIGNMLCFRCTHLKKTDLFEDLEVKIVAEHPDAEQVIGVPGGSADMLKV